MNQKNTKRDKSKSSGSYSPFQRGVALVGALIVPLFYLITLVLFFMGNSLGQLFLALSLGASLVLMPILYALTRLPHDAADAYGKILDAMEDEKKVKS